MKHHPMSHPLEPAGQAHRDGVAEVDVRGGRVDAELHRQRPALGPSRGQQAGEVCAPGQHRFACPCLHQVGCGRI
jgi:hypothetical protein